MRIVPCARHHIMVLVVAAALPAVPLILFVIPLDAFDHSHRENSPSHLKEGQRADSSERTTESGPALGNHWQRRPALSAPPGSPEPSANSPVRRAKDGTDAAGAGNICQQSDQQMDG
jgi:hypothetical protein